MKRRNFLGKSMAGGLALGGAGVLADPQPGQAADQPRSALPAGAAPSAYTVPHSEYGAVTTPDYFVYANDLVIERNQPGKPHKGKVLAAVQAHSDDIALFSAGTVQNSSTRATPATSSALRLIAADRSEVRPGRTAMGSFKAGSTMRP